MKGLFKKSIHGSAEKLLAVQASGKPCIYYNNTTHKQGKSWTLKRHFLTPGQAYYMKTRWWIQKRERGSLDSNLTYSLSGIRFPRCQLCCHNLAQTTKMHFFYLCLINIRVFTIYPQQKVYKGIGERFWPSPPNFIIYKKSRVIKT